MADEADLAGPEIERANSMALRAVLSQRDDPQDVDEAGRVWCLDCGCQISEERLSARPTASRCVPCGSAHEHHQRFYVRGVSSS